MHPNYRGPYSLARFDSATIDRGDIFRHNDGSVVIMGQDVEGESAPVLTVPMRVRAKRGEAWRTADPEQEAFAQWVVDSLNAAAILESSR